MLGSGVLDTAIGLIFVFLLVSMLVTIVNEMISAMFLSRAKWLRKGIDRLLDSEWAQKLYEHPLIEGSATVAGSNPPGPWTVRGSGPSYIPSRSFANVLLDVVRRGDSTLKEAKRKLQEALDAVSPGGGSPEHLMQTVIAAAERVRPPAGAVTTLAADLKRQLGGLGADTLDSGKWIADLEDKASKVSDLGLLQPLKARLLDLASQSKERPPGEEVRNGIQAAIDSIPYVAVAEAIKKDLSGMLERLKAGYTVGDARADVQRFIDGMPARYLRQVIERFPSERISKTLLVLLDDAEDDVDKFKQNIEVWFNNAMDRVGGWYKRRSQWVITGLSLLVAVSVNVDTILVVKHLETHPGVRDALVAQAKAYAESKAARASGSAADVKITTAGGADGKAAAHSDPGFGAEFNEVQAQLTQLNLPVGWVRTASTKSEIANRQVVPQDAPTLCDTVTFHLPGWLITALAATLGAPFWFDTLNRFISIRSAGKAPEEKPKPPKDVPTPLEPGQSPREADAVNAPRKS